MQRHAWSFTTDAGLDGGDSLLAWDPNNIYIAVVGGEVRGSCGTWRSHDLRSRTGFNQIVKNRLYIPPVSRWHTTAYYEQMRPSLHSGDARRPSVPCLQRTQSLKTPRHARASRVQQAGQTRPGRTSDVYDLLHHDWALLTIASRGPPVSGVSACWSGQACCTTASRCRWRTFR